MRSARGVALEVEECDDDIDKIGFEVFEGSLGLSRGTAISTRRTVKSPVKMLSDVASRHCKKIAHELSQMGGEGQHALEEFRDFTPIMLDEVQDLTRHGKDMMSGVRSKQRGASLSVAREATHLATHAPQVLKHVKREKEVISGIVRETTAHTANVAEEVRSMSYEIAGEVKSMKDEMLECISSFVDKYKT